jgi:hypothetical protein
MPNTNTIFEKLATGGSGPVGTTIRLRPAASATGRVRPMSGCRFQTLRAKILRVECRRCSRCVEIQRLDAVKLYGPNATWRDVRQRLLDDGCRIRMGRRGVAGRDSVSEGTLDRAVAVGQSAVGVTRGSASSAAT